MNTFAAIYFPESQADNATLTGLLTIFDQVSFYPAIEDDPDFDVDIFFEKKLSTHRIPAPIGPGRENFLRFINDFKGHEAEYYSGWLSNLSTGIGREKDEATVWSLIQSLQGGKTAKSAAEEIEQKQLWQARLVLKLSELLVREEEEIQQGLQQAAMKTSELMRSLKGDDGREEPEIPLSISAVTDLSKQQINVRNLLTAWGHMYMRDKEAENFVAATSSEQSAMEVFDVYEGLTGKRPQQLCVLEMPTIEGSGQERLVSGLEKFRARFADLREEIQALLKQLVDSAPEAIEPLAQQLAEPERDWRQMVENQYSQVSGQIIFYLLPEMKLPRIVERLVGAAASSSMAGISGKNCLLALLNK